MQIKSVYHKLLEVCSYLLITFVCMCFIVDVVNFGQVNSSKVKVCILFTAELYGQDKVNNMHPVSACNFNYILR